MKCIDPSFGQRKLMAACHELEITHGLTRDKHGLGAEDQVRHPVKGRVADMEAQSGRESFTRWIRDHAREDLLAAKATGSWEALHQAATRQAQLVAQDVELGDRVMFYQGRPVIVQGRDRDSGRNTGLDR